MSGISEYAFQDGLMQTTENGASLTFKFSGTTFGILSNCFDGAGVVDCTVDGKGLESWGSWVVNHRAGFGSLPMPTLLKINLEPGEHTAVIKKIEPSGYNNGAFQFGYFLVEEPLSEPLIKIGGGESSGGDENEIIINSIYPKNKAEDVSVLEDVTVELAEGSVASESDVQVLGNGIPDYNVEINGETINIEFTKELPYYTDITVKIGNNTNTFITERNPIKTLFYEDFEGNAGESLARFENVGQKDVYYCVYDNKLLMQTHETRQPDGGTPCIRNNENAILYIKGSENWSDYTLDLDVANGWYTKAGETGEYYDSEAMISVKTDKATGNGVSLVGRWVNPGRDAFFTIYPLENFTLTGDWHGGWNVFNSQYRTNHHMTIDAIGKDVAFKFTGYGSDISNKWTDAVAEGAKGGVTLRSSWGRIVYDNILVTDKGLLFTPTTIKNVKDELVLSFTKTLDDSAAEYIRVLKDGVDQNVEVTLGDDAKKVYVNVSTLTPDERYTLSVGNGVMSTDGTNVRLWGEIRKQLKIIFI